MKIKDLISDINKEQIVLPEFQREFVWKLSKSKSLIKSLFNDYPVTSLILWKTDNPPEIKNEAVKEKEIGTVRVILDGQQRLTTLYLLLKNEVPPYYDEEEISYDPRHLYFNLKNCEFKYETAELKNDPLWVKVVNCFFENSINSVRIAKKIAKEEEVADLAEELSDNLQKLKSILTKNVPKETVPPDTDIDEAIDIFDKVNTKGTKLTDAELALTHITGKWSTARRVLKNKITELKEHDFELELSFMVRCLVGIVEESGEYEKIHRTEKEKVKEGWKKLDKILDYLITILPKHASIHSTKDINTTNIFVPLVVYLAKKGGKFPNREAIKEGIQWLYLAHLWRRYTGQTTQRLDNDIKIAVRNDEPWSELKDGIIDQRGRIELTASDIEGRGIRHPAYTMLYIVVKAQEGIDWYNGSPLDVTYGDSYSIHKHHIFPKEYLYKEKYDSKNHLDKKIVNEIANRAFLTAQTNMSDLKGDLPSEYLPKVVEKYGEPTLEKQFVPVDERLWKIKNYEEFLQRRRELIAEGINKYIKSITEEKKEEKISPEDYISKEESDVLEFKSSMRWDYKQGEINKDLEFVIAKTIDGFLNSKGGTLLIGVSDNQKIKGIKKDLKTFSDKDKDSYHQNLMNVIKDYFGIEFSSYVNVRFEDVEGKEVCIIEIEESPKPVFLKRGGEKKFFIRAGNTTRELNSEETHNYIKDNWKRD